ncbi:MAG: hypothetical protein HDR00_07140 [Lachnospiraceae bacterium]|nr:hypothetical protein [Lachnospiraceae bacterium]
MQYNFFYDETEHSRKINYQTVTASNYYDNFITAIVGWSSEEDANVSEKYLAFESKYDYRKKNGELKSQTMKAKDLMLGFASLNNHIIEFYEDLISLFDDRIIIYFSVFSKIEYVINQLFVDYHNSMFVDVDYMKYSIIKAINVYRPQKLIEAIYKDTNTFVEELRVFLEERISKNQANILLKEHENNAFEEILIFLDDVELPETLDWSYFAPFDGFKKLLMEMNISNYKILIDREGNASHTLNSAMLVGLENVAEEDSKDYVGIRMADMFAGLISKLMQSLKASLMRDYKDGKIEKTLLDTGWFALSQRQLDLYKKLYRVICENNNYWYKIYAGIYSDDLVAFVALLQYMNHFENVDEIQNDKLEMQSEYYNTFVCECLQERYKIMRNKLPLEPMVDDDKEYFYNQRGAKVYKNIEMQPMLPLDKGQNKYYVLSVGFAQNGVPLVTISENGEPSCYRLPDEYSEWAMTVVGIANSGGNYFPEDVIFSLIDGRYYVDVL